MKIEKKSVANIIPFRDVPEGTVFEDKNEAVCMKVAGSYGRLLCLVMQLTSKQAIFIFMMILKKSKFLKMRF